MLLALAFLLGLIFGSFGTVVAHRVPHGENIVTGRSRCPSCGHTITALENLPVLSWVVLRGRCRSCGIRISPRYPLIELATGILFALSLDRFGVSAEAVVYAAFFWVLVVLTMIDLDHQLLPTKIVLPAWIAGLAGLALAWVADGGGAFAGWTWLYAAIALGLSLLFFWPAPREAADAGERDALVDEVSDDPGVPRAALAGYSVATVVVLGVLVFALISGGSVDGLPGALAGGSLYALGIFLLFVATGGAGMGDGDFRLALVLGAFLGYLGAPAVVLVGMFLAFLLGGLLGIGVLVAGGGRKTKVPFGPFLAIGAILSVFVGERVAAWYGGSL